MSQVPKDSDSPKMLSTFDRTLAQTITIKNKHLNVNVCVNPTSQTNDLSPKQNIKVTTWVSSNLSHSVNSEKNSTLLRHFYSRKGPQRALGSYFYHLATLTIEFILPNGSTINWTGSADQTIQSIKATIADIALSQKQVNLQPISRHFLKIPGAGFVINENVSIVSLPYVQNCLKTNTVPHFLVMDSQSSYTKKIKMINKEIGALVGRPLVWTQNDDEVTAFRQTMTRIRYLERKRREASAQMPSIDIFPVHLSKNPITVPGGKHIVMLRLSQNNTKGLEAFANETADEFISRNFKHIATALPSPDSDFVLKATGLDEYIYGPYPFFDFEYVRECLVKKVPVNLSVYVITGGDAPTDGLRNQRAVSETATKSVTRSFKDKNALDEENPFPDEESFLVKTPEMKYDHLEIIGRKNDKSGFSAGEMEDARAWEDIKLISVWQMTRFFRFKIVGIENIDPQIPNFVEVAGKAVNDCDEVNLYFYITAGLYHGGELLEKIHTTTLVPSTSSPRWNEWVNSGIKIQNLPRETRICFTLWVSRRPEVTDKDIPLAWVNMQLFDYKHELKTGILSLNMWSGAQANPIGTVEQSPDTTRLGLFVKLDSYSCPVVFPTERWRTEIYPIPPRIPLSDQKEIKDLIKSDPLFPIPSRGKKLLWKYREYIKNDPKALPKFLLSVPRADRNAVQEMYYLLDKWAEIQPLDALELLDSKFADSHIRKFAVDRLELLSNEEVLDYLLQLVQVLKYEPYHDSALARFLIRRSLSSRNIGHSLFWLLKSETHVAEVAERYNLLLEAYLRGVGQQQINQLTYQQQLIEQLIRIANMVRSSKETDKKKEIMYKEQLQLLNLNFPGAITLPLNPRIQVSGIVVESCKYMHSKKMPLWLVFKNADPHGENPVVIFKSGDDLRQDMLTLQIIRIMDKIWKKHGLDLQMTPYRCVATGHQNGMIEVVLNAKTTANIAKGEGGGAAAAFKDWPLAKWLHSENPTDALYARAVDNFIKSCAGYCVATYVLGVGDRHNDNVMLTTDGRFFHIDFGHFLGNFKKKFGIKREKAPFVFTPDFAFVMGGKDSKDFKKFENLCCDAFSILRRHSNLFLNLFAMMLSTGIPELQTAEDIWYLRNAFALDLSDEEAMEEFKELIYESLNCTTTRINNWFHMTIH